MIFAWQARSGYPGFRIGWAPVDVSRIRARLNAEFQASNHGMYRMHNAVAEGTPNPAAEKISHFTFSGFRL